MTLTTHKVLSSLKLIILALILAVGIQYSLADWSVPLSTAPICTAGNPGCDAPINVGANSQTKVGSLTVNSTGPNLVGLTAWGQAVFDNPNNTSAIQIIDGNQGTGKILTSDGSGNGTWQAVSNTIPVCSAGELMVANGSGGLVCGKNAANIDYADGCSNGTPIVSQGGRFACASGTVNSFDGGYTSEQGALAGSNINCTNSGDQKSYVGGGVIAGDGWGVYVCYIPMPI